MLNRHIVLCVLFLLPLPQLLAAEHLLGKSVTVEAKGEDRYKRTLGIVRWLHQGKPTELNKLLVTQGLAWHYVEYSDRTDLAKAQNEARAASRGLWQDARKVTPWDYRNGQRIETSLPANLPSIRETDTKVYITKTGSKYHRSGCRYLSKSAIEIPLSRASAYEPCSKCNPPVAK